MNPHRTVVALGSAGAPDITYNIVGDTASAELDGAKLYAELTGRDETRVRITSADGVVLADVTLHPVSSRSVTENLRDVGAALLWSHWRWVQLQKSKAYPARIAEVAEQIAAARSMAPAAMGPADGEGNA